MGKAGSADRARVKGTIVIPDAESRNSSHGGTALLLGLLTRLVALLLGIEVLVAILAVHVKIGLFASKGGLEFLLALLAGLVALVLTGAQRYAIDTAIPELPEVTEVTEHPRAKRAA